ncbi:mucin-2 [Boleophthalmus pectinirostris]|uniref:mucin-2 n=1 Tax=Boleophthalmus pectinirostris TaxID=150288 RepID=UPI000A1C2C7E|nr:mucin-2 [Boleophthalmus pectinirostris]
MEQGHITLERGVSCPGRLREPLQPKQDVPDPDCTDASWEQTSEFNKDQMSRKTNLSRSTSLSEKELKEARVRSQIIAAQLTVPSNSSSRGVQLFNRRRQRVNAFTQESGRGSGSREDNVTPKITSNKPTWAERSSEEKNLNLKNSSSIFLSTAMSNSDIMEESGKDFQKADASEECVIQERHFLPVKDPAEEEDKIHSELEDIVKAETPLGSNNADPVVIGCVEGEAEMNEGTATWSVPAGKLPNGCHSSSGPESQPMSTSKQIINRTARPFFSPPTVQSPEAVSPVMDIPPAPSYSTPPLPAYSGSFSPPPPAPSYPTPPLPAFTNQPPHPYYSSPPPMSPTSPPPHFQQYNPSPHHFGPPTAPKPSTFIPQSTAERKTPIQIKTGILEEGAARRANRKAMFTFKEKPIVAPNPELLSMVRGVDAKKKLTKSIPEPSTEEELMALGAEASNFLAKEEVKEEEAKAPEWASSLKTSRTRPSRVEQRPEQTLTNVAGKGAELFAKRQSRMEKYVVENQRPGQRRSPSPTMSLPPSWVYPSNMPGRVKAIAKNSEMSAQLSQNLIVQQAAKQKPKPKVPIPQQAPQPAPPPAPIENGCSKIEMDLSRHRPYQLDSSLFILKPVQADPMSTLPRGAPQAKTVMRSQSLPRQTVMPSNPLSQYRSQCMSPPMAMSPTTGFPDGQQRISSPAFSPERVTSPRSVVQAPRPTFSAKKAGLEGQPLKESSLNIPSKESPTVTTGPSLTRRFSSPADPSSVVWGPARSSVISPVSTPRGSRCQSPLETHRPAQTPTGPSPWGSRCQSPSNTQGPTGPPFRPSQTPTSPSPPPWGSKCQSPMMTQTQTSTGRSAFTSRPSQTATSPVSPPWATRCKSPVGSHNPSATLSVSKPAHSSPVSPPWGSRSQSPLINHTVSTSRPFNTTAPSPVSPWGSRCQSPAHSQSSLSFSRPLHRSAASSPVPMPKDSRCMSPTVSNMDSKANHRLLAKNIINAAKRKNSVSPGALSGHSLPISPVGTSHHDSHKPPISPFHSRSLGAQSPTFTSPPPTPTQVCSPVRLYNTRSLTDSDASVESEDSGLRSPGLYYNSLPRGWGGSLRVKRSTVSTDL